MPDTAPDQREYLSSSPAETADIAADFARTLEAPRPICLVGPLGAGKTHFVKGLALGLGVTDAVTSPTFSLAHEYAGGRWPLVHLDLYRLKNIEEAYDLGIDDYFRSGIVAIEWGDRFPELLPQNSTYVTLAIEGDLRRITFR